MNKALPRILWAVLVVTAGLAFTLALSPSTDGAAHSPVGLDSKSRELAASTKLPAKRAPTPTPTPTPTATPEPISQPGSTDGIMVMSFAIAVIIVLPILLQRELWTK